MNTYRVVASHDEGKYWLVHIVELDQYTQARTLTEIPDMAREFIALTTQTSADEFGVDVHIELPADVKRLLDEADSMAVEAARLKGESAARRVEAAKDLKWRRGLTVREIGAVFGVSHQRAQQLVNS
jgi:predicted RNase H-like HicB family nuclease